MNTSRLARLPISALVASLWCCASTVATGGDKESSPDLLLKVNNLHLPVFFEDATLTGPEKGIIITDYQSLLDWLEPNGRHQLSKPMLIQREGESVTITSALRYSTKHLKRPDGYEDEFGLVAKSGDEMEYVVVKKKLSDGYRSAMVLMNSHKEAYRALPHFVTLLNNIDEAEVPAVKDFFYLPGPNKKFSKELASAPRQKIVDEYRRFQYTLTSILELRMFEDKLAAIVHAANKDDGHLYQRLVIYDEGHWKIVVVAPGA